MKKKQQHFQIPKRALGHTKLEPRRLLSADFNLTLGGALTLNDFEFSPPPTADDITISESGGVYTFVLSDGSWDGDDSASGVTAAGGTLTIDTGTATLTSILMDSNLGDSFDIEFGDFNFSGSFDITSTGGTLFGDITQIGSTSFIHAGTLDIDGATNITLDETVANDFDVVIIENATTVDLVDSNGITFTSLESTANSIVDAGGTVTHHHAVGRMHAEGWADQRPALFGDVLKSVKRTLDPNGILNPGVLFKP